MNKFLLTLLAAASVGSYANAEVKVTVTPLGDKPEQSAKRHNVSVATADVVVNEDFAGMQAGTVREPDFDNPLTSGESVAIDPSLTGGEQWEGFKCYSAGGACALRTFNPYSAAYIATPQMDLSGTVKVSILAKYLRVAWEEEDGIHSYTGSSIGLELSNHSDKVFDLGDGETASSTKPVMDELRLYENQGWCRIDVEFDNYSAYNDAQLVIFTSDGVLVDEMTVSCSSDKFIACPVITGITDVTEDSFTVEFEPVRKSFNYYTYLYEVEGYDEETGEPKLKLLLNPQDMEAVKQLEEWGMTFDDYIESLGGYDSPYVYYGDVDRKDPTRFRFYELDPEKDYYFGICSHYVKTFSTRQLQPANVIAAPVLGEATDVTKTGFKAHWSPIKKAENYEISLYGVNNVLEDTEDYVIFDEDFSNVSAYTSAKDITDPDYVDSESGLTMDDLTSTPGWKASMSHVLLVEDKIGLEDNYKLNTPSIFLGSADSVKLSLKAESTTEEFDLYVGIGDDQYRLPVSGWRFEGEMVLPTKGVEEGSVWVAADEATVFIDYMVLSQDLKKGDRTYTYLGKNTTENGETEFAFADLDNERFDMYGYSVRSFRDKVFSTSADRMLVDLNSGSSVLGAESLTSDAAATETARYTIDGRRIDAPQPGVNIVKYSDGSVRKVFVK